MSDSPVLFGNLTWQQCTSSIGAEAGSLLFRLLRKADGSFIYQKKTKRAGHRYYKETTNPLVPHVVPGPQDSVGAELGGEVQTLHFLECSLQM